MTDVMPGPGSKRRVRFIATALVGIRAILAQGFW
ncbi:hypothetical protein JOF56_009968 [Kibdelosporangium banguiense]|uniref:Uncharacterized protein n=1 Tax=Kibdelosporangium banguiense TaxID=1365924 RepID=A0ABS4TYV8_9PSEU|nr:hypothetical protein [Kibdelosporangium banguiense]